MSRKRLPVRSKAPQMAMRPQAVSYEQLTVDTTSTWTVQQILDALEEHELGNFFESSKLIDAMGRDERIRADRETRVNALVGKNGAKFAIEPHDGLDVDAGALDAAKWARGWWYEAFPESQQRACLRNAVMSGVAYGPLSWTRGDDKQWLPCVNIWSNQHLYWDDGQRCYIANTTQGPQVVSPETGWFLYTPDADRSWMIGAVRALALLWKMRQFNWRDFARFCERHGLPLIAIEEPPGADDPSRSDATAAFYRQLRGMGSTGVVRLPQLDEQLGWKLEYKETKGANHAAFTDFHSASNAAVSICLLGQNINEEGGSYAKATALLRVAQHYLDSDAETLATACRNQIIIPAGRFNRRNWNDRAAPWPAWETGLPEDKTAKVGAWESFANALDKLLARGVDVDIELAAEQAGLPLRSGVVKRQEQTDER